MEKYYNRKNKSFLDPEKDCCRYKDWNSDHETYQFALHDEGFFIFLKPLEIEELDDYKNGDPYGIEDHTDSQFHHGRVRLTLELLAPFINESNSKIELLDVGCGQGHITKRIKEHYPGMNISAVDLSLNAICYAKKQCPDIDFIVADIYKPPYVNAFFDIVVCNNMWEHVTDPASLSLNIHKLLKPDGLFILSTPSRYRTSNILKALTGKTTSINKYHITEYSVGQITEILSFAGFKIEKIKGLKMNKQGGSKITRILVHSILKNILAVYLSLIGSHHQIESTVFFVARKLI